MICVSSSMFRTICLFNLNVTRIAEMLFKLEKCFNFVPIQKLFLKGVGECKKFNCCKNSTYWGTAFMRNFFVVHSSFHAPLSFTSYIQILAFSPQRNAFKMYRNGQKHVVKSFRHCFYLDENTKFK